MDASRIEQFITDGFVRIDDAFPRALADEARAILWKDTGCDPADPSTWTQPVVRLGMYAQPPFVAAARTATLQAAYDALVGPGRWRPCAAMGTFPVRFPSTADPGDEVNREETFGPLLTLIRVPDADAAVSAANATSYGLVGAVHGADVAVATAVAERLECGLIRVNAATPGVDYYAPFGGEKRSSFGPREQGRAAREFFTTTRTVTVVMPGA